MKLAIKVYPTGIPHKIVEKQREALEKVFG